MTDWYHNDELFFKELQKGFEYQDIVQANFEAAGLEVISHKHMDTRPRRAKGETYDPLIHRDESFKNVEKDLVVAGYPIEVKSRALAFTSPTDYPYATAFVDTVEGWAAKVEKPIAVVLISQKTKQSVVVSCKDWEQRWTSRKVFDRKRRITVTNYEEGRNHLKGWDDLVHWLEHDGNVEDPLFSLPQLQTA